jgi:hypothetical protein
MTKILSVDGERIDEVLNDFSKLIIRLEKNSKKTRNVIKKIVKIRLLTLHDPPGITYIINSMPKPNKINCVIVGIVTRLAAGGQ